MKRKILWLTLVFSLTFGSFIGIASADEDHDSDLAVFASCFFQVPEGICVNADFNNDKFINFLDLGIFASAQQFDLDGDGKVTYDRDEDSDLTVFASCFFQAPEGMCMKADFNNDNFINFSDLGILRSSLRFDLNGDGKVTFDMEDNEEDSEDEEGEDDEDEEDELETK